MSIIVFFIVIIVLAVLLDGWLGFGLIELIADLFTAVIDD